MNCQFCKNTLKNKYILLTHQKTNKKCLDIQHKINNVIENKLTNCSFCEKSYSFQNLKSHLLVCKKKKKLDNQQKIDEIKKEYEIKNEDTRKEYEKKTEDIIKEYEKKIDNIIKENQLKIDEIKKENFELRKELEIKDEIYKDEHKTIKKLALQPKNTTTNNNIIGNLNLDDTKRIKDIIEKEFNPNNILDGQKDLDNFDFK